MGGSIIRMCRYTTFLKLKLFQPTVLFINTITCVLYSKLSCPLNSLPHAAGSFGLSLSSPLPSLSPCAHTLYIAQVYWVLSIGLFIYIFFSQMKSRPKVTRHQAKNLSVTDLSLYLSFSF